MKRGIVGGTFDPIHVAHCYLMEECAELLDLDQLLVIPNGDPPHKDDGVTQASHRLAMAELATRDYDRLEVSDMEIKESQVSYTWLTLTRLKKQYPEDELYFIMGGDSMAQFRSWKQPETILRLAHLVCFDRPGHRREEVMASADWIRSQGGHVTLIDSLELEISSTDIRQRVASGRPHRSFLHPAVYQYIHEQGLYQTAEPMIEVAEETALTEETPETAEAPETAGEAIPREPGGAGSEINE